MVTPEGMPRRGLGNEFEADSDQPPHAHVRTCIQRSVDLPRLISICPSAEERDFDMRT